jgi:hypothetical protein
MYVCSLATCGDDVGACRGLVPVIGRATVASGSFVGVNESMRNDVEVAMHCWLCDGVYKLLRSLMVAVNFFDVAMRPRLVSKRPSVLGGSGVLRPSPLGG